MDWQFVLQHLRKGDGKDIRFFSSISSPDEFGQALVAMANTDGGHIFIGVNLSNYHLVGIDFDKAWLDQIIKYYFKPQPNITVEFVTKNNKTVCIIAVKDNFGKPYYYKNKCYVMDEDKVKVALLDQHLVKFNGEEMSASEINAIAEKKQDDLISNPNFLGQVNEHVKSSNSNTPDFKLNKSTDELVELNKKQEAIKDPKLSINLLDVKNNDKDADKIDHSKVIKSVSLNDRQQLALQYLEEESFIKNKMYRELFDVSHKTAHLELVDLVNRNLIRSQGSGRSTCYVLNNTKQASLL